MKICRPVFSLFHGYVGSIVIAQIDLKHHTKKLHHLLYLYIAIIDVTRRDEGIAQFYQKDLLPVKRKGYFRCLCGLSSI